MNAVEFDAVLKVDSFNFGYALEIDPKFIELEYPFYWADVYELTHEFYDLWLHGVAFSKMKIVMLPLPEGTNAVDDLRDDAISPFSEKPIRVPHGGHLRPGRKLFQLQNQSWKLGVSYRNRIARKVAYISEFETEQGSVTSMCK